MKTADYLRYLIELAVAKPQDEPEHRYRLRLLLEKYLRGEDPFILFREHRRHLDVAAGLLEIINSPDGLSPQRFEDVLLKNRISQEDDLAKILYVFSTLHPEYANQHTQPLRQSYFDPADSGKVNRYAQILSNSLRNPSPYLRSRAVKAFVLLGAALDLEARPWLLEALCARLVDENPSVIGLAIEATAQLGAFFTPLQLTEVLAGLLARFYDYERMPNFEGFRIAIEAIGNLGSFLTPLQCAELLPVLRVQLRNQQQNISIRCAALKAITQLGAPVDLEARDELLRACLAQVRDGDTRLYDYENIGILNAFLAPSQRAELLIAIRHKFEGVPHPIFLAASGLLGVTSNVDHPPGLLPLLLYMVNRGCPSCIKALGQLGAASLDPLQFIHLITALVELSSSRDQYQDNECCKAITDAFSNFAKKDKLVSLYLLFFVGDTALEDPKLVTARVNMLKQIEVAYQQQQMSEILNAKGLEPDVVMLCRDYLSP